MKILFIIIVIIIIIIIDLTCLQLLYMACTISFLLQYGPTCL